MTKDGKSSGSDTQPKETSLGFNLPKGENIHNFPGLEERRIFYLIYFWRV